MAVGKGLRDGLPRFFGQGHPLGGQLPQLVPECSRVTLRTLQNGLEPAMLVADHEGPPTGMKPFAVTIEDCLAGGLGFDAKVFVIDGEQRAGRQAQQIVGIGQRVGLVEIVDAPGKPAQGVVPGAEVLQMKITHRQDHRRGGNLLVQLHELLCPAVIGGAQEAERILAHRLVLVAQVAADDCGLAFEPTLEFRGRNAYIHGASASPANGQLSNRTGGIGRMGMNTINTFYIGVTVQLLVGVLQVAAAVLFVYRWQRRSWQFTNIMNIREPLARAYCSLSAVVRARRRIREDQPDKTAVEHDHEIARKYLAAAQDEIVNFSVEHFKAKFWLSNQANQQLDVLFEKLREEWKSVRNEVEKPEDHLDDLRREILHFDTICGLQKYNGGQWSHVALYE